jgi:hypothetical protein
MILLAALLAQEVPTEEEGVIVVEDTAVVLETTTPGLSLAACSVPPPVASIPPAGEVAFKVVVNRKGVKAVTTSSVEPGLEWITPCLERELAAFSWEKKGKFDVNVTVRPGT